MSFVIGALSPALLGSARSPECAEAPTIHLAEREPLALDDVHDTRRNEIRRRIHDRADDARRIDRARDRAVRIRRLHLRPSYGPPSRWKYHHGIPFCIVTMLVVAWQRW